MCATFKLSADEVEDIKNIANEIEHIVVDMELHKDYYYYTIISLNRM
jgi:hypothetical protein